MMKRELFEESLIQPIQFWSMKSKNEVRSLLGEEVTQMVKYDQRNSHHCYDLFLHTLHTVQFVGSNSPVTLLVAAFFHDIGKPYVAKEKQGRLVFYGHAQKSAEIARPLLYSLGYTRAQTDHICFFISHHDDFISWVLPAEPYDHDNRYQIEITVDNVASHIEKVAATNEALTNIKSYELWTHLLLLCHADVSAQAEYVYRDSVLIDSREHKLRKVEAIQTALDRVFV